MDGGWRMMSFMSGRFARVQKMLLYKVSCHHVSCAKHKRIICFLAQY